MKPKPSDMNAALEFLEQVVRTPAAYPERFVAIPRNSPVLTKLFSREPNRILDYLQKHGRADAVQEIADALKRNKSGVSRDIKLLVDFGLVTSTRHGKEKVIMRTDRLVVVH